MSEEEEKAEDEIPDRLTDAYGGDQQHSAHRIYHLIGDRPSSSNAKTDRAEKESHSSHAPSEIPPTDPA